MDNNLLVKKTILFITLLVVRTDGQKSGHLVPENADASTFLPEDEMAPRVLIAILVRNKAHTLPYFLTLLQNQDYPKDRIAIWIRSDHNEDNTTQILRTWGQEVQGEYHDLSVEIVEAPPKRQSDQETIFHWSSKRFQHVIRLKEEGIRVGRKMWADYIWLLDADVFLLNNQTLKRLISKNKDLVAPMLLSGGLYSNFWAGMKNYYYLRTEEYKEILEHKKTGCFPVPLIHSAVLMSLKKMNLPNFSPLNSTIPEDDIIRFATSAEALGLRMEICNDIEYGYILSPVDDEATLLSMDLYRMENLRVEVGSYWPGGLPVNEILKGFVQMPPSSSPIGWFDQVYLINLKRRPDRRQKMDHVLGVLGIEYTLIEAVDGRDLSPSSLKDLGISQLPEYRDPFSLRLMTFGEIGCFLSHFKIWERMVKYHVNAALILEDDIRFEPFFVHQVQRVFEESARIYLDWDLIYLGRKRSQGAKEPQVEGSKYLVEVDYSYWTLGYALTLKGAKKLLAAQPLQKLVPVDEFLPIMFDKHINMTWKLAFERRDLKAFSVEPLLLYPTHYTNEPGYISDTERSVPLNCSTGVVGGRDEL